MDKELFLQFFSALARHGATTLGGILAANGWITQDDVTTLTGIAVSIVGLGFSVVQKLWAKRKTEEKVDQAKQEVINTDA